MGNRIALNGFGRLGRLTLMGQALPYLYPFTRRKIEEDIESLKEAINDADAKRRELRMYPKKNIRALESPESVVTNTIVDTSDLPNPRYHDRTFPKDYYKRKKAKLRQQRQSRRKK